MDTILLTITNAPDGALHVVAVAAEPDEIIDIARDEGAEVRPYRPGDGGPPTVWASARVLRDLLRDLFADRRREAAEADADGRGLA
jgi:hypothetical protein